MPGPATIDLRDYIRDIPDFPKPGILFKDITPLLSHPEAFRATDRRTRRIEFAARGIDVIAAAEARGFIFGAPLALEMNAGFVPIRKPGKLPYATIALEYQLEYGTRQARGPHRRLRAGPPRPLDRRRAGHRRHDARLPRPGRVDRRRGRRLRVPDRALVPGRPRQARARSRSSALITLLNDTTV